MNSNEQKRLDQALDSKGSQAIREIVKGLPEEELSMLWRSQLNDKIQAMATPKKSRFGGLVWKTGLGLGLAGVMAFAMIMKMPSSHASMTASPQNIEATLLNSHAEGEVAAEVAGPGSVSTASMTTQTSTSAQTLVDWSMTDTEAL